MSKKTLIPLAENQTSSGPSSSAISNIVNNGRLIPKSSGFIKTDDADFINVDILATGNAVDITYAIQSLDYWSNIIDLHTGRLTTAGNVVVEIDPNAREFIRTNLDVYNSGAFYATASLGKYGNR